MGPYRVAEDDIMLHVAPMFHSADLLGTPFSLAGAGHAYLPDFTPDAFLNAVEKSRATFTMLSPTVLIRIIREGRLGDFDISSLRRLTYGSAPIDTVWLHRAMEALPGVELVHSYGLTETSPILTTLGWNHHLGRHRMPSVGRPLVGIELRVVDEDGNDLPAGEAGESVSFASSRRPVDGPADLGPAAEAVRSALNSESAACRSSGFMLDQRVSVTIGQNNLKGDCAGRPSPAGE